MAFTLNAIFAPLGIKKFSPSGNQAKWFYKENLELDEQGLEPYRFVKRTKNRALSK